MRLFTIGDVQIEAETLLRLPAFKDEAAGHVPIYRGEPESLGAASFFRFDVSGRGPARCALMTWAAL